TITSLTHSCVSFSHLSYCYYLFFFTFCTFPLSPHSTPFPYTTLFRSHQQDAIACLEHLHRQHPGHIQPLGDRAGHIGGIIGHVRRQAGGRREHLGADAALLHGLHHGPHRGLARGPAGDEHGQFAGEVDLLLQQHLTARMVQPVGDRGGVLGRVQYGHSLAVVPAHRGLGHHRPAEFAACRGDPVHRGGRAPPRARHPEFAQPLPHDDLVLRVLQRTGAGLHVHPGVEELLQDLLGYVFVFEGEYIRAGGDLTHGRCVVGSPHHRSWYHLGRGPVVRLDQRLQANLQRAGWIGHHAGELPASYHGYDWSHG